MGQISVSNYKEQVTGTKQGNKVALDVNLVDGGSAGSEGGTSGNDVYSSYPSGTEGADGTTSYNASNVVNVDGLDFLFTALQVESVTQIPVSGSSTVFSNSDDFTVAGTVGDQTITVAGASFASTDSFKVSIKGPDKYAEKELNANRGVRLNRQDSVPEEHIIDEANQAVASYYTEINLKDYDFASVEYNLTGSVTGKVYLTNNKDASTSSTTDWVDFTAQLEKSGASTLTGHDMFLMDTNIAAGRMMLVFTTTGTTNTTDVFLTRKTLN